MNPQQKSTRKDLPSIHTEEGRGLQRHLSVKSIALLIAEDDFVLALEPRELLKSKQYLVVGVAHSGAEAITMSRSAKPDLNIVGVRMPGAMDGIDAAKILRRDLDPPPRHPFYRACGTGTYSAGPGSQPLE